MHAMLSAGSRYMVMLILVTLCLATTNTVARETGDCCCQVMDGNRTCSNDTNCVDFIVQKWIDEFVNFLQNESLWNPTINITFCEEDNTTVAIGNQTNNDFEECEGSLQTQLRFTLQASTEEGESSICQPLSTFTLNISIECDKMISSSQTTTTNQGSETEGDTTSPGLETTATTQLPTTKKKPPAAGGYLRNLDDSGKNIFKSDKSDPTEIVEVKKFNGTTAGSKQNPVYKSGDGPTTVESIKLEDERGVGARAVVIDKTLENDSLIAAPDYANNNFEGGLGSKCLIVSAYLNRSKLKVERVKFTLDTSGRNGLNEFDQHINRKRKDRTASIYVGSAERRCAFINDDLKLSEEGCNTNKHPSNQALECDCNHATVFAVLLSVKMVEIPAGVKYVSYVTEIASIFFLTITGILLVKVRKHVRGDRVKVQICVTFSILIFHILNVFHDAALPNDIACELLAVLLHFFLLYSAMWMLLEGVTLVCKTMDEAMRYLSGRNAKKFAIFRYVVSAAVPAIIVLISASVGLSNETYMTLNPEYEIRQGEVNISSVLKYNRCWVSGGILVGAVIVPVALILSASTLIILRMCYVVFKMSSESENYRPTNLRRSSTTIDTMEFEHVKAALKATMVLLPVLGVPWILGFFSGIENEGASVAFMYINAILNGLQGVFLFFVYCVIGKEVRMQIIKSYVRKKYTMTSAFEFTSSKPRMLSDNSSSILPQNTATTHVASEHVMESREEQTDPEPQQKQEQGPDQGLKNEAGSNGEVQNVTVL